MRWGVRDEATDDHMTTELCMTEIHNCQRLSVGPNFVVSAQFGSQVLRSQGYLNLACEQGHRVKVIVLGLCHGVNLT